MEETKHKSILINPEIKLEYIYNEKNLDFDSIKNNPILKPISEINKNCCDLNLTSIKGVLEFEEEYKKLQELELINPRYTTTVLMTTINKIVNIIKTIIHSQDLQIISMKKTINEMVCINDDKYKLIDNEKEKIEKIREDLRKEFEEEHSQQKKETLSRGQSDVRQEAIVTSSDNPIGKTSAGTEFEETMSDLKDIVGEEEKPKVEEKKEVMPKKTYSSLLEREI